MRNLNPKINPVTTILGATLIVSSLVMFAAPMFLTTKEALNYKIPGWIGGVGICLLLIPDDFTGALRRLIMTLVDAIRRLFIRKSKEI